MTSDSLSLFDENLRLWTAYYSPAEFIFTLAEGRGTVKKAVIKPAASGDDNLCCRMLEGEVYFYSQADPKREAEEWFKGLELDGVSVLYVYGIGLGYYYDAAKSWLEEDRSRSIVFFEDEIEVLRVFLNTERCRRMLEDQQVLFFYSKYNEMALFNDLSIANAFQKYLISKMKTYQKLKEVDFKTLKSALDFVFDMSSRKLFEHFNLGVGFYRNYILNMLTLPESKLGTSLFGKFKGLPAIICGAGPSLEDNGKQLAELADRAIIFAGASGMNALNALGVIPHFGVGIDPNPDQFTRLVMNIAYETPYFYRCRLNNGALKAIHGEKLYLTGSSGYAIGQWFEKQLGIESCNFPEGHNVLTFSVVIAQLMGIDTIVCAGIDLAYTKGKSYTAGISSHPIHPYSEHFITKNVEEDLIDNTDIFGKNIKTLWKWLGESLWYTGFVKDNPDLKILNATEGGIGFNQIDNIPLAEAAEKYLKKEYDIAGRIYGEIATALLPGTCTEQHIKEIISSLSDSLDECGNLCNELVIKLLEKAKEPSQKATLDGKIEGLLATLREKDAYQAILEPMETNMENYTSLNLLLKNLRKPGLTEEEIISIKAISQAGVMKRLKETASANSMLIRWILADISKDEAVGNRTIQETLYDLPGPSEGEKYHFDGTSYELIDPDFSIHYKEEGTGYEREVLEYPSGKLKMETHYKGGRIHGPSRFYDEKGNLLSESWFINGKRSGKMRTFHLGGALHSIRGYMDGKKSGVHFYFYPDGMIRSILPYSADLLSGEVSLYHPRGILERKITFVDGVREGFDRIWDRKGTLRIEAEFVHGMAFGIAKEWHSGGALAKEVVYGPNSEFIEKRTWDTSGLLMKQVAKGDFFDMVNLESDNLMAAIGGVVNSIENVLPDMKHREELINFARDQKHGHGAMDEIQSQFNQIKSKMDHLKHVGMELDKLRKVGVTEQSKEPLWKSAELRTEIEKSLKKQGAEINEEMEKIRKGIKDIIEKLKP